MAIRVDTIRPCIPNSNWRWSESCHMFSDDLSPKGIEELHRFAERLELKREWFQNHSRLPHYDLTTRKRKLAIKHGAVPATDREMVTVMRSPR